MVIPSEYLKVYLLSIGYAPHVMHRIVISMVPFLDKKINMNNSSLAGHLSHHFCNLKWKKAVILII